MFGPHQAERCPGHRAGKGQIHLLNIHLVGKGLWGVRPWVSEAPWETIPHLSAQETGLCEA